MSEQQKPSEADVKAARKYHRAVELMQCACGQERTAEYPLTGCPIGDHLALAFQQHREAEREACCKAVCRGCRAGAPIDHVAADGVEWHGWADHRAHGWSSPIDCSAAAIRARK